MALAAGVVITGAVGSVASPASTMRTVVVLTVPSVTPPVGPESTTLNVSFGSFTALPVRMVTGTCFVVSFARKSTWVPGALIAV